MALNIKDPDTHALARRLAAATGESLTEAVRQAVAERLTRVERTAVGRVSDELVARLEGIARHCGALPGLRPAAQRGRDPGLR